MGRLVESTFVTLDGVISNPQDWSPPYWDEEHSAYASRLLMAADALLLGRRTYEGFAAAWPSRSGDPYADTINAMPKHVATTTLHEATWNASLITGDVPERVAQLKDASGQNLLKFGTGVLDKTLIEHGLVDEFHFWVFPVIAGTGDRLLDGMTPEALHLALKETTRLASGIVIQTCTPA